STTLLCVRVRSIRALVSLCGPEAFPTIEMMSLTRAALAALLLVPAVAAAETASARLGVSARVVRPCRVDAASDAVRVSCASGRGAAVRVQADRQAPRVVRLDSSGAVTLDEAAARRVTIEF